MTQQIASRLQSLLDRMSKDERTATMFEADGDTLRDAMACIRAPLDLVLFCPKCGVQHIDALSWTYRLVGSTDWIESAVEVTPSPEIAEIVKWTNPPHRSHRCTVPGCGHVWRPADSYTNGVSSVKTHGKADSEIVIRAPASNADWFRTTAELAAIYGEMATIGETNPKDQTPAQVARLKTLRSECVEIHYKRINLNQQEKVPRK